MGNHQMYFVNWLIFFLESKSHLQSKTHNAASCVTALALNLKNTRFEVNWKDAVYKEKGKKRGAFPAAFCSFFNVEILSAADKPACKKIFHAAFQRSSNSHLQRTRAAFDFWLLQIYRDAQIFFTFTFQSLWSTEQDHFVQRRQLINSS